MFFARKKREAALRDTIDRLGAVRDALRVLRVREEALLEELATYRPADHARGNDYELEKRREKRRRFDRFALPKAVREDSAYWKTENIEILTLVPLDPTQKAPTADQIAATYAETHDLPIGLPEDEATYGAPAMPQNLPLPAAPMMGADGNVLPQEHADDQRTGTGALEAAEPSQPFDFAGVPRYRTGQASRRGRKTP